MREIEIEIEMEIEMEIETEIKIEIEKTLRDSETLRPFKMGSGCIWPKSVYSVITS